LELQESSLSIIYTVWRLFEKKDSKPKTNVTEAMINNNFR